MRLKKNPDADLENKRGLFFEIGLLVILLLTLLVFGIGSKNKPKHSPILVSDDIAHAPIELIEIPDFAPPKEIVVQPVGKVILPVVADILTVVNNDEVINLEINSSDLTLAENLEPEQDIDTDDDSAWDEEILDEDTPVIMAAEAMPMFDNGDLNAFRRWVAAQFQYPEKARERTLQGVVSVEFYVEKDGSVTGVSIVSSPDRLLADEVLRVVSESPRWIPGMREGKPTKFKYLMDVDVRLTRR